MPEPEPLRLCLCVFPFAAESVHMQLSLFVKPLQATATKLYLITSSGSESQSYNQNVVLKNIKTRLHYRRDVKPNWWSVVLWAFKYALVQIKTSYHLARVAGDIDIVVCYFGPHYALPIVTAKILRKKVLKLFLVPTSKELVYSSPSPLYYLGKAADKLVCTMVDWLIMGSDESIRRYDMEKYRKKIIISPYNWAYKPDVFREKIEWHQRKDIIGYIGRLRQQKGVLEFVRAVPLILARKLEARFLIVGSGEELEQMKNELRSSGCLDKVDFTGEVPPERIPDLMNEMKFLICPSHFELAGGVNFEAMACGTVVIANAVGGVPDIVKDHKTGFLLKDNQPQTIADKVIEVWEYPELDKIRKQAREYVRQLLSYQKVVEYWGRTLRQLVSEK